MSDIEDEAKPESRQSSVDPDKRSSRSRSVSIREVAEQCGGEVMGNDELLLYGMSAIRNAEPNSLSFWCGQQTTEFLDQSQPAAVLVTRENAACFSCSKIIVEDPYLAYARVSALFAAPPAGDNVGIDPTAKVHPDVLLDDGVIIGPFSVVGANCKIGKDTRLGAHVVIDENCVIGADCRISAGVILRANTRIGNRCQLSPGVVIGASGFGYAPSQDGWQRITQLGGVVLGDDVDVGANTTIDRGAIVDTIIGNRVKLDNQIQLAHNVKVGDDTIMAGCVAIAGSTEIGARCQLGGRVSVLGHLRIADEVVLNAGAFVSSSISETGTYSSMIPAQPVKKWRKTVAYLNRLGKLFGKND
ncbi:MAG: UDP-3-O-(3-hydroxymyristoyl)glucosamine N-acyltransferase [Acidiferrobacterales bacterium]|nr:UDP-3-O-(3-hydroxymyristoyl)glucosamine N-acyltransferase [Acidiferrobacterales bacterium]